MISRVIWHTPRVEFQETILDDGGRENIVRIHGNALLNQTQRAEIVKAINRGEYKCYPKHLFREDGTEGAVTSEYSFVECMENGGQLMRYRIPAFDVEVHEMYLAPVVNADPNDFKQLPVLRQFMECVNSLESVRPGIARLIAKEVGKLKLYRTSPKKSKKKRKVNGNGTKNHKR